MNRSTVVAKLRAAGEEARRAGVEVHFRPGWTTRGRAGLNPQILVEHTTEDSHRLAHTSMLSLLENGHGAIAGNAICTAAVLDDASVHLLSSGVAWHAGAGSWAGVSGNSGAFGTEYQRHAGSTLTDAQQAAGAIWSACVCRQFGWNPLERVCEHFEFARPAGRKRDRLVTDGRQIDPDAWRRQVAGALLEEDVMATLTPAERQVAKDHAARIIELGSSGYGAASQTVADARAQAEAGWTAADYQVCADLVRELRSIGATPTSVRHLLRAYRHLYAELGLPGNNPVGVINELLKLAAAGAAAPDGPAVDVAELAETVAGRLTATTTLAAR